jgi:N utilization substance protein A
MENFFGAGFESIESIVNATDEELLEIKGMTESKIGDIRLAVNMLAPGLEAENAEAPDEETSETPAEGEETI